MIRRLVYGLAQKYRDIASRAGWTALQVAIPIIGVIVYDLPPAWVPIGATALSALKSWIATKVGNTDTVTFVEPEPEPPTSSPPQPTSGPELRSRAAGARTHESDPRREYGGSTFRDLRGGN